MELNDRDKESTLWKNLTAHFNELLDKDRRAIEKTTISMEATFILRGRIKILRELLELDEERKTNRLHDATET